MSYGVIFKMTIHVHVILEHHPPNYCDDKWRHLLTWSTNLISGDIYDSWINFTTGDNLQITIFTRDYIYYFVRHLLLRQQSTKRATFFTCVEFVNLDYFCFLCRVLAGRAYVTV